MFRRSLFVHFHLAIISSVLQFTASDYPFAICWPLYRLLLRVMPSDHHIGICWPVYRLSYFDLCLLITLLSSFPIVSSVLLQCMPSDYPFGIFWPLYRLSYFDLWLLITPLVSFGQCIVCPTLIYALWLPHWYLVAIVSSVLLRFMPSDYHIGIFYPTSINAFWLPLCYMLTIVSSVLPQWMPSDYPFVICWPLYRLSDFDKCLLITPLVSFGHCIVCHTSIYAFWLPHWYFLAIVSSVLLRFMPSDYPFGIIWPLHRLSYFDLCLLITPLISFGHWIVCPTSINAFWLPLCYMLAIVSSVLLWLLCLLITILISFGHCIVCPTSIYAFWLPLWYLLAIVSSVLLQLMPSDYPFVICWPMYRLSYFDLCLLITTLVSFGHCIVCPTLIYAFWLPLCYMLAIVSSVLLRFVPSDYPFVICWPLYRLSYFKQCLLITPLLYVGHCIVCLTSNYAFWLPLW